MPLKTQLQISRYFFNQHFQFTFLATGTSSDGACLKKKEHRYVATQKEKKTYILLITCWKKTTCGFSRCSLCTALKALTLFRKFALSTPTCSPIMYSCRTENTLGLCIMCSCDQDKFPFFPTMHSCMTTRNNYIFCKSGGCVVSYQWRI